MTATTNKKDVTIKPMATFNFKKVKVDVSKIDKTFVTILQEYLDSKQRQADIKLVQNKFINSEKIKLKVMLEGKDINDTTKPRNYSEDELQAQQDCIDGIVENRDNAVKDAKTKEERARDLIKKEAYTMYTYGDIEDMLSVIFETVNVQTTPTLCKYFIQVLGMKNASNNQFMKNGMLLTNKGYTAFVTSMLNGICDLLIHKNVLTVKEFEFKKLYSNNK